jgi:hypothetical protein
MLWEVDCSSALPCPTADAGAASEGVGMWTPIAKDLEPDPTHNMGVLILRHVAKDTPREILKLRRTYRRNVFLLLAVWTNPAMA